MILNMGHTLATLPLQLLSGTVFANTNQPYNYGFPDYGYTQSELNNPAVNNPYQNATEVAIMLNNNTLGPIIQKESLQCFGVSFVDGTSGWDTNNSSQPINLYDSTYRQQGCGAPNGLSAQQWLQVRMFIFDTQTIKGIDCYEGNNNSCISNGFTGAVAANFTNPSPRITLDYMGLS